ncbi:MAG TPA: bifunctional lysylphosphatidylglycerol flippase/synthetase MprF [Vicinamibacterales bacterium]|nr:bifunctional lysylphosphatidylglycerol flippase/synthetase MprF [Vicinamibacterales bacterium]
MGASRLRLAPVLGAILFVAALFVLREELRGLTLADLSSSFARLPNAALALALLLTAVNYTVLTGYDQLAFIYLGRAFPRWQISMASFVGYAIANNFGFAVLSGTAARYRFYSRWGLSASEISRIVVFYSGTFWLGLLVLGGWSLLASPPPGLARLPEFRFATPIGLMLVSVSLAYAVATFVARGPIKAFGVEFKLPTPRLASAQFALSIVDWGLAVAVLWVLFPEPRPPFSQTVSAFVAAQVLGLLLNVPGGLGVFEAAMLLLLGPAISRANLLSSLVAFRVIYYLLPLLMALIVLIADEYYQRRHLMQRWGTTVGAITVTLAPKLIATFTFIAGAVLLFSGATPAATGRLAFLAQFLPEPVVELSHFLGSLIGLFLLLISQALARRVDAAWTLSVIGLVLGIAASLLKGADYEEATFLSVLLLLMFAARHEYDRRATLFEQTFSPLWFSGVLLVVLASIVLGVFAFRNVQVSNEFFWRYSFRAEAPRALRALVGVAVVLLAVGVRQLLRPATPIIPPPTAADMADVDRVIASQRTTSAFLAYLGDKGLIWSDDRSAFLMYALRGRTWVALHDPVGPARAVPVLIHRFLEQVDDADGVPVFYQVRKDHLHHYADFGLAFAKAGEEALVPLSTFTLEGGARKKMRFTYNRLSADGASIRVVPACDVPAVLPALREVSDDWLKAKGLSEKGFSLGFFDERYLARFPVAVLEVNGRIEAFANMWPGPGKVELSVDLMRHRASAPKNSMEGLFIYLMQWGKAEGYQWFNLGMAPLSGLEPTALAPLRVKLASYLYRFGQPFYNFQGLRSYKEKFHPVWEPRYLAYPGVLDLPRVLRDVSALIAGGYGGILKR